MKQSNEDFRRKFDGMSDLAIVNRKELAELLCKTPGAVSNMAYRGLLPETAFPDARTAAWFVKDIREWLIKLASRPVANSSEANEPKRGTATLGRPRLDPFDLNARGKKPARSRQKHSFT